MSLVFFLLSFYRERCHTVVESRNFWLNSFPRKGGTSKIHSPITIVLGEKIDYNKHCQLETGQYVEVHEKIDNTTKRRTEPSLYLHQSRNNEGGGYFMKIDNGEYVHRNIMKVMPMPEKKVGGVHQLSKQ